MEDTHKLQPYAWVSLNCPLIVSASKEELFAKLAKLKWNVHIRERYTHGQGVAHYLARYLMGGPTGNSRLLPAPTGKISFKYYNNHDKDGAGRGKPGTMTL